MTPRTDSQGRYELLLRSRCPFCDATVYLARHTSGCSEGLFALHEETRPIDAPRCTFDVALAQKPHDTVRDVMKLAPEGELESFFSLTASN